MRHRKPWTAYEDECLRAAARANQLPNGYSAPSGYDGAGRRYNRRLKKLAEQFGRTYAAVYKRASRIRARSYMERAQRFDFGKDAA